MKTILVTGAQGFIGKNLCLALRRQKDYTIIEFNRNHSLDELSELAASADVVFHLAGVNRPKEEKEFAEGNAALTQHLCNALEIAGRRALLAYTSSTQAERDNPYGRSKKEAEDAILSYHERTHAPVCIYRFPNVFGKWSRPNYNTVVATFCHNISRGLAVQISDRSTPLRLAYVDDIVQEFQKLIIQPSQDATGFREFSPVYNITLGELHDLIISFRENREKSQLPDLSNPLVKYLYSTYISFYEPNSLAYPVELKTDERGWLFELIKSPNAGQIFVSRTRPGVTRGNHYHHTKIEKFCVIQGSGVIRFRHVLGNDIVEYPVNDQKIQVVDIPPGYTHSIENVGKEDMLTLFWANEIFDPQRPDTCFEPVKPEPVKKTS
jgi:UDP-2-acetamido-2,6-beta-L-arabino-hexul-4-ose reductase